MNTKTDYTKLKKAILRHAKDNFGDGKFTVINLNEIADQQGVARHHIKTALKQLVIEKAIIKVGATAKVCRGGSPANNFRLNKAEKKPAAKSKREHQLIAAERIANMNTAQLRLAKALGIPMGVV